MANLKDTIVLGNLTVTGTVTASDLLVSGSNFVTTNTNQTITGTKTFKAPIKTTSDCLGPESSLQFVLGIEPFDSGGAMKWQYADKFVYNNIPKFHNGVGGVTHSDWQSIDNASSKIPTMNFIAYWNGAYDNNGNSNLIYCSNGTMVGGSGSITKIEKVSALPSSPDSTTVYFITG